MNKLKSIIKKLLNLLSSILIIILVVYIVLVGYQKIFNKNNLLKKYRSCYYHVLNQLQEFIELLDFLISKEKQELI